MGAVTSETCRVTLQ